MKKLFITVLLITSCATCPPRDLSLGCMTDMECELWEEQADETERLQAEAEMDNLVYYIETGKIR
jgi:hypothetical protein